MSTPRRTPVKGTNRNPNAPRNNVRNSPRPPRITSPNVQILTPSRNQKPARQRPNSQNIQQGSQSEASVSYESPVPSESAVFQPQAPTPEPGLTTSSSGVPMSPTARYHSNLKVLRRRDPSIVSIFDQFPHVCIYRYDGKWVRAGYEGTMFLYER